MLFPGSAVLTDSDCNYFAESVQSSLERKFGKNGGAIPILPSDEFERRISVSMLYHFHIILVFSGFYRQLHFFQLLVELRKETV